MLVKLVLAWADKREHKLLTELIYLNIKRAVRMSTWYFRGKKLNCSWHSATMAGEPVWNSFINNLVNVKSKECLSRFKTGQASRPYKRIGKHFVRIKLKITCSDANRPTLLKIALNDLKNEHFALWKLQRKTLPLIK